MHLLFLTNLPDGRVIEVFCRMLIHSLWEGLLFTILTGAAMMLTTKASAVLRYNIVLVLFFLFIAACFSTFIWEWNYTGDQSVLLQPLSPIEAGKSGLQYFFKKLSYYFTSNASFIVLLWFITFCGKCVKMASAFVYNSRVKSQKINITSAYWKNKVEAFCAQLNIKKTVLLFESAIVKIPVVIGHLKPVIFIPVGLLTSLPAAEVEAVLLHELAHVRRNDYFVNIIQVIAENIFFFNPALLWMSSLLREERENCCDDIAIAQTKSKKQFIQALISFKEHASYTTNYTTAFPAKKNQLLQRVTRIINNRNHALNTSEKTFFLGSFLLLTLLFVTTNLNSSRLKPGKTVKKEVQAVLQIPGVSLPVTNDKITATIKPNSISKKSTYKQDKAKPDYNRNVNGKTVKQKPFVSEVYAKVVIDDNSQLSSMDREQTNKPFLNELIVQQQAEFDRQQAEKDREQAMKDRAQAARDMKQAELDRLQAQKDREQALKDMKQAELDRQQALKDRQQAEKERLY